MRKPRLMDADFAAMNLEDRRAFNELLAKILGALIATKSPEALRAKIFSDDWLTAPTEDERIDTACAELLIDVNL